MKKVCLDASAFLDRFINPSLGDEFYTLPLVLDEIKDEQSQQFLSSLPFSLKVQPASKMAIRRAKAAATKTGDITSLSPTDIHVIAQCLDLLGDEEKKPDEESKELGDDEGWITPEMIGSMKLEESSISVICISNDFSVQNVLSFLGIPIMATNGVVIRRSKLFVLRCHACMCVTRDMSKHFCPDCGGSTLIKTSAEMDQNGKIKVFLKKNFRYNNRGTVYSVPAPVTGHHQKNIILREDQKEYQRALKTKTVMERKQQSISVEDDFGLASNRRKQIPNIVVGYGKKNINEARKKKH